MGKEKFIDQLNGAPSEQIKLLYKFYYKSLVLFAMTYVDQEDIAKDMVQDLFVSLWESPVSFSSEAFLKSYLYNSVRNKCLNHLKHIKVQEKHASTVTLEQNVYLNTDEEIEEQEIYRKVFAAIDKLPPRCKQVFELHLQGKKNQEIAHLLEISIETVKVQKKRAMRFLRENIGPLVLLLIGGDIL